jgi:hypothetical protein
MTTSINTANPDELSFAQKAVAQARQYFSGRRGLILLGLLLLAVGLALSWKWLVAVGIAPILVALAPCAAMCALGLCMNKMGGKSCSSESQSKGDRNA